MAKRVQRGALDTGMRVGRPLYMTLPLYKTVVAATLSAGSGRWGLEALHARVQLLPSIKPNIHHAAQLLEVRVKRN